MGIDISGKSSNWPKSFPFRVKGKNALRLIEKSARKWVSKNELGPLFVSRYFEDKQLIINLFPAAGDIIFELSDTGLTVDFRTTPEGPGYHIFVSKMLYSLGKELDCSFHIEDDTDFAEDWGFEQVKFELPGREREAFVRPTCAKSVALSLAHNLFARAAHKSIRQHTKTFMIRL